MVKIKEADKDNHVFLDDPITGMKKKVKTFDKIIYEKENEHEKDTTQVRLVLYQPTQNQECFVFSIFNQDTTTKEASGVTTDQKLVVKKSYFFITKTSHEMRHIIASKSQVPIISMQDDIFLLKSHRCIERMKLLDIRAY